MACQPPSAFQYPHLEAGIYHPTAEPIRPGLLNDNSRSLEDYLHALEEYVECVAANSGGGATDPLQLFMGTEIFLNGVPGPILGFPLVYQDITPWVVAIAPNIDEASASVTTPPVFLSAGTFGSPFNALMSAYSSGTPNGQFTGSIVADFLAAGTQSFVTITYSPSPMPPNSATNLQGGIASTNGPDITYTAGPPDVFTVVTPGFYSFTLQGLGVALTGLTP